MPALGLLLALALVADAPAAEAPPRSWSVVEGSTLSYHLVHKFHAVTGVCRSVEGKARLSPDGRLEVAVRARVDAFDSGNSNRDAHMMEVTDAHRLPFVTLRADADGVRPADAAPFDVALHGTLDFHGVVRPVEVTAHVRFPAPDRAEVEASFPVSLGDHAVERPSLLFVKVEDRITIAARLLLAAAPP